MRKAISLFLLLLIFPLGLCFGVSSVSIPGGSGGIEFDDVIFAPELGKILVPSGQTGNLNLVDPGTRQVTSIGGFGNTTSSDEGTGLIFAADRKKRIVAIVDPKGKGIIAAVSLAGGCDYVRYVKSAGEVWVTDPGRERIEVFTLNGTDKPVLLHADFISVPGGPESLVIDNSRQRAYANLWRGATVAIDIKTRAVVARWSNGCAASRGLALDEKRGFLFVAGKEGRAVVLDVNHDGKMLSSLSSGSGADVISYNPALAHLYLPGGASATMAMIEVSEDGILSLLSVVDTARGSRCAAADDRGNVWVTDPSHGQLLIFHDEQKV